VSQNPTETAPTAPPIRVRAGVISNTAEGAANYRILLRAPGWPGSRAGQFAMLSPGPLSDVPRYDPLLSRPMAVYRDEGDEVEVLYKVEGRGTRLLAEAEPGEEVQLVGPLGNGFPTPSPGQNSILVGGGTGVASLYGLARDGCESGDVHVILGARSADLLMATNDFEKLSAELSIVTEDGSLGSTGMVTDVLRELIADPPANSTVFACGPTPMMRACSQIAEQAGIPCLVALENRMACGFGVCLGCAVPLSEGGFSLICNQGPVYDSTTLDWEGLP
jgi:dihydroorotate dehydrogenase electron transfer subunit